MEISFHILLTSVTSSRYKTLKLAKSINTDDINFCPLQFAIEIFMNSLMLHRTIRQFIITYLGFGRQMNFNIKPPPHFALNDSIRGLFENY